MAVNRPTESPDPDAALNAVDAAIRQALHDRARYPLVVGLCGAQGSGKSTLATALAERLNSAGITTATLSIDDLYLGKAERQLLADTVHPLFRTRGVPGTHDVTLGINILHTLDEHRATPLPRFDKAQDDRTDKAEWPIAPADTKVLIFEGWCVGALPQTAQELAQPVNDLEQFEDPAAIWHTYANAALAGDYQRLFARIDFLILLAAPDFSVVHKWRIEQENDLRRSAGSNASAIMSDTEISRFIQHFERLTRHILFEMPSRADMTIALDEERRPIAFRPITIR